MTVSKPLTFRRSNAGRATAAVERGKPKQVTGRPKKPRSGGLTAGQWRHHLRKNRESFEMFSKDGRCLKELEITAAVYRQHIDLCERLEIEGRLEANPDEVITDLTPHQQRKADQQAAREKKEAEREAKCEAERLARLVATPYGEGDLYNNVVTVRNPVRSPGDPVYEFAERRNWLQPHARLPNVHLYEGPIIVDALTDEQEEWHDEAE